MERSEIKKVVPIIKRILAYSDGSYNKKIHKCSYGVIMLDENENIIDTVGGIIDDIYYCNMRNVGGEIIAAQSAIQYAIDHKYDEIIIYHDYTGVAGWATTWQTNNNQTKAYKEFCQKASEKIKIKFIKVKSHTGDKYNEMVDIIAKQAAHIPVKNMY